jgi:hypothetical protein
MCLPDCSSQGSLFDADRPNDFTGIAGVSRQDQAVTNGIGAIYDRSKEHLGSSDAMIMRVRRRLLNVVREFADT